MECHNGIQPQLSKYVSLKPTKSTKMKSMQAQIILTMEFF
jgi:hypothetical protein